MNRCFAAFFVSDEHLFLMGGLNDMALGPYSDVVVLSEVLPD